MDFFLEIHNGECGLGEHFGDLFLHRQNPEVRSQDGEINRGESTLLIKCVLLAVACI